MEKLEQVELKLLERFLNQNINMAKFDKNGFITELEDNEIFVFGSNVNGFHSGGAAKIACDKFGAEWGHSEGRTGKCWAIATLNTRMEKVSLEYIKWQLEDLVKWANRLEEDIFYLTPIGQGIAGFTKEEIESIMPELPKNIIKINWK